MPDSRAGVICAAELRSADERSQLVGVRFWESLGPHLPGDLVTAINFLAAIGNGGAFRKGREFAAWVGLVPREQSTGGRQKLLGISKRGNLRSIFVMFRNLSLARALSSEGRREVIHVD